MLCVAGASGCGENTLFDANDGPDTSVPGPLPGTVARLCQAGSGAFTATLVDALGRAQSFPPGPGDIVVVSISGLASSQTAVMSVTAPDGSTLTPGGGLRATADEDGCIANHTIVQTVAPLALGNYTLAVTTPTGDPLGTLAFTVADRSHVFCTDSAGTPQSRVLSPASAFAVIDGAGLDDGTYDVYVIGEVNRGAVNGSPLAGLTTTMTVAGDAAGPTALGSLAPGAYDVVIDVNGNERFDSSTDLISHAHRFGPCFVVESPPAATPIVGQFATDRNGNARDVFDPIVASPEIRDVYAFAVPPLAPAGASAAGGDDYIVPHADTWTGGETLLDASGGAETAPLQLESSASPGWLAWPRAQLCAPGCYDLVVDVNRNGVYDAGTDFLDNIDFNGAPNCGFRVADATCTTSVAISAPRDGSVTLSTTAQLTAVFGGTPVSAEAVITSGTQSNTVGLNLTGSSINARVPLFRGTNLVTVAGVYPDGTTCAKTLTVASAIPGNDLIRIQMTWDGDTDMDLHFVRPGGAYSNGGGGTDDCNFANCAVGIDGVGTNSINWGNIDLETDDPKLDVDCIACGVGIENIFMGAVNENGEYRVFVDAFSGGNEDVDVTVFVRGAQVGRVHCPAMTAGTSTDSCFAGTINWTGGNNGTGSFVPAGALASDF